MEIAEILARADEVQHALKEVRRAEMKRLGVKWDDIKFMEEKIKEWMIAEDKTEIHTEHGIFQLYVKKVRLNDKHIDNTYELRYTEGGWGT